MVGIAADIDMGMTGLRMAAVYLITDAGVPQAEGKEAQVAQLHTQVQELSSRLSQAQEKAHNLEAAQASPAFPDLAAKVLSAFPAIQWP